VTDARSAIPKYEIPAPDSAGARTHRINQSLRGRRAYRPNRHVGIGVLGAATAALLHLLLIGITVWGGAVPKMRLPDRAEAVSGGQGSAEKPVVAMILMNEQPDRERNAAGARSVSSRPLNPKDLEVPLQIPDPYPVDEALQVIDLEAPQPPLQEAHDDSTNRTVLLGRYLGQINARVERAWLRPRTALDEPLFQCQVEVQQRPDGVVTAVRIDRCNGNARWQQSLIEAVRTASPLPAPPDPSVFTESIALTFESAPYQIGGDGQGFETDAVAVAVAKATMSDLGPDVSRTQAPRASRDIALTIRGDQVIISPLV